MAVFPSMIKFFVMVFGNTMNTHMAILDKLTISQKLREVQLVKDSHVVIAFVPIVSRAGTDIFSAMERIPKDKPVILIVLHHTFDKEYIPPDSRLCVNQDKVFAVDCLYYEDQGLLRCLSNDDALRAVKKHLGIEENNVNNSSNICDEMKSNNCTAVGIALLFLVSFVSLCVCIGLHNVGGITAFSVLFIGACIATIVYCRRGVCNRVIAPLRPESNA